MTALDPIAARWREALIESLRRSDAIGLPLFLSGGMDSATLLAALLSIGEPPPFLVAYHLDPEPSEDSKSATALAESHGVRLEVVVLPRDHVVQKTILRSVAGCLSTPVKKTHAQCAIPFVAMLDRVCAVSNARGVVLGTGGICEDNRTCMVTLAQRGEDAARAIRRENLLGGRDSATEAMKRIAVSRGFRYAEPYSTEPVAGRGLMLDLAEINRPRQKGIALRAFPEFFRGRPIWRKNTSLQVASGLRAFHDAIAPDEGHRSAIAMLRTWVGDERGGDAPEDDEDA